MNIIKETIIKCRPNLSKSSVITYASILKNLYNKVFGEPKDEDYEMRKFKMANEILHHLQTIEPNKRKTILSALVIITDNKEYREQMLDDIKAYNIETHKQEKTPEQAENWIEQNDIKTILSDLENEAKIIYKKKKLSNTDLQAIQNYIIVAITGGVYIPPRRSKDYVAFKVKNIDKDVDNYMDKNKFVFNAYKTAKTYGTQSIDIPSTLSKIIKKWIKVNPTDYLFFDSNCNPLTNVKLNQRMNKIFNKKASVNVMRHSYLSSKYGDKIEELKEMKEDMSKMGTSMTQSNIYIQK